MSNELYMPIFENEKFLDPGERSVLILLEIIRTSEEGKGILLNKFTKKTHSTMTKKVFISLYLQHNKYLVKRSGWTVF